MPSGAKKRKAAKKKKENESSSNTSNQPLSTVNSHGDDDSKHQDDDKETDGGEVSSPASQDHHSHQQDLTEEEEEVEKGEDTSNFLFIEGVDKQKMVVGEGSVVQVEKELKSEGGSEKKDIVVEYDELHEKSYDGGVSGSSSSSSSSSDDESHNFEKNKDTLHNASVGSAGDSVVQTRPVVGLEKVSLLNEEALVNKSNPLDISEASRVSESELKENGDISEASCVSESELKENGEKLKSIEENVVFSAAGMDVAFDNESVEAIVQSAEIATETSDAKECAVQETDDKLTLSYGVPRVNETNGAEHQKDSEVPEPVADHSLHPVQTTSWKSCCGLFELLTGSGR